jgi:hypothetical protein
MSDDRFWSPDMIAIFLHLMLSVGLVWMILHFWLRLPLYGDESPQSRIRDFIRWTVSGMVVPATVWFVMNLGLASWLPPFYGEVDVAKSAGEFWLWTSIRVCSPALPLVASYWAGISLVAMAWMLSQRTREPAMFRQTTLFWSLILGPLALVVIYLGGFGAVGFALILWVGPILYFNLEPEGRATLVPSYAAAIGKLKFGKYSEAEMEIIRELETCENDFNGWMMLAELYAVHFQDFDQAQQTVIELCDQPDMEPSNVCVALHRLADWHLELKTDPQGARRCMEAISKRYPGTHLDRMARLRLRRMPRTAEALAEARKVKPLPLPALHEDLDEVPTLPERDRDQVGAEAEALSRKLSEEPNNTQMREEFARALAKLGKTRPALEQIGMLLAMSDQPAKRRAEWLALRASWMTILDGDGPTVRQALHAIIREFPGSPQSVAAQRRLFQLDEKARVAKYAGRKKKPRPVVRLDGSGGAPAGDASNR